MKVLNGFFGDKRHPEMNFITKNPDVDKNQENNIQVGSRKPQ
jgi:hypothetical protein